MASYDLLATYPENVPCENCGHVIGEIFYTTISGRVVCSQKCAQELPPSPEDSCYICGNPVWEDEYYATRTKYFCSDQCKDIYQNNPNIQNNFSLNKNYSPFEKAKISEKNYLQNGNYNYNKQFVGSKKFNNYEEPKNPFYENSSFLKQNQKIKNSFKCFYPDSVKAICSYCGKKILGPEVIIFSSTGQYCSHECLKTAEDKY